MINLCSYVLTVVAIATEQLVETYEVRSAAEVCTLRDQYLFNETEVVNDNAWYRAESDAVYGPVYLGQRCETLEGYLVLAKQM